MDIATLPDKILQQNDWFDTAYHIGPMSSDHGSIPFGPCLSCRIQYKNMLNGEVGYESSSQNGGIIIVDAVNYEFAVPAPIELPLPVATWLWKFETFETSDFTGPSRTFYKGKVIVKE